MRELMTSMSPSVQPIDVNPYDFTIVRGEIVTEAETKAAKEAAEAKADAEKEAAEAKAEAEKEAAEKK